MKKLFYSFSRNIRYSLRQDKKSKRLEGGQVLVIVALSVIVLTAIVGLTVDVGLVYLNHGKLRRAVDAAALAATAQFREGYDTDDLQKAALEFLVLNGINDPSATVETCKTNPGDPVLCTTPERKLVRVHAASVVKLTFMSVLGIHETSVSATAVSEAASMDVVLVIDASESMTYDAARDDPMFDPGQCNPLDNCHPFKEVKAAAAAFVDQLYFPYDRVAIVTFDDKARTDLSFSDNKAAVLAAINGLEVVDPGVCPHPDSTSPPVPGPCREYERDAAGDIIDADGDGVGDVYLGFDCPVYHLTGNPDTCPTTAIGQGLKFAGNEFGNKDTFRQEALWVVILLTDGAANAPTLACPNNTWTNPYCRDLSPTTRHCFQDDNESCLAAGGVYWPDRYDADDYARDMADFVSEDQKALIFTIGLGDLVRTSVPRLRINDPTQKCTEVPYDPVEDCYGAGEQLMRYAADVGGGKYYYAPSGNQLRAIFLDIAQYLATRLTQ
jgi:Flp pilus assembly protein TadG